MKYGVVLWRILGYPSARRITTQNRQQEIYLSNLSAQAERRTLAHTQCLRRFPKEVGQAMMLEKLSLRLRGLDLAACCELY
jgi:hypothetical protein